MRHSSLVDNGDQRKHKKMEDNTGIRRWYMHEALPTHRVDLCVLLYHLHLICSQSLFLLITEMWSYLSAHISFLPLWIFISQQAAQLIRSEHWMFQSSGSFFPSPLYQLPLHASTFPPLGCKWWKKNTRNSPLSFPIVSLPISPSETSLPFGSPAFKFKDLSGAPLYFVSRLPSI